MLFRFDLFCYVFYEYFFLNEVNTFLNEVNSEENISLFRMNLIYSL